MRFFQKLGQLDSTMLMTHALKRLGIGEAPLVELWVNGKEQEAASLLPQYREAIFNLMRAVEATRLVRASVQRVEPGERVSAQSTHGYEIVLAGPGALSIGGESPSRALGDVWWWQALSEGATTPEWTNDGDDEALSLLLDLET